ncbi:ATP-dependent DNA ligase [Daejeonella lutea]|uniref:DNA ligase (ATP) n=1 Tax=Daejeonella lutea TaxID=572036 RepID=A0A1T5BBL9_9SPHI|nr:ATP-dependent DNA ligase [Daejeonella lutea]SKB44694.1 DNA ligase-1 [Daejeonella lutea]
MKRFTELFLQLDRTNKTNEKVELLKSYFLSAPDEDKIWALALFTGRRPPRKIKSSQVQEWALELAGIPYWLFRESYGSVGDLAETVSLILPQPTEVSEEKTLAEWFSGLADLKTASDEEKKDFILKAWRQLSAFEIFVFNKLLMGSFRIGVSQTLVTRAISEITDSTPAIISHRLMGSWDPASTSYKELIHSENAGDEYSKPYPFYLSYAIQGTVDDLGSPEDWFAEWKWDGIRSQIIYRDGEIYIWSRGEELITDKFPELHILKDHLPEGTVLDGELICFGETKPLSFNVLQTRIGRKNLTKKILEEAPAVFIAYDLMEFGGKDIRNEEQKARRKVLETIVNDAGIQAVFKLSPLIDFREWQELKDLHLRAREFAAEGFMLKHKEAPYLSGRKKGDWWKWKTDPLSIDAVLVYAQKGSGRRAELYTDYTFAVWDEDKLVPFAKAYSGLTDKEIGKVDYFIKRNTLEKFGPVRTVKAELVFEIGFEGINASTRHKSGIAVRFPRILRWRTDKTVNEADTLQNLKALLSQFN